MFKQLSLFETYAYVIQHANGEGIEQLPLRRMNYGGQLFERSPGTSVSVTSVHMESPLVAILEIPPAVWVGAAFAFLALAERLATAPVRIARKRKEEQLKIAITDEEMARVHARADALGLLLLDEGPYHSRSGPDEIVFLDPDDPNQQLVDAGEQPRS